MLGSVVSKYDGFMTWLSSSYDFAEQGQKHLVNTCRSATVKVWISNGGLDQRVHATLAERAGQSGGLAKRRLKSMVLGWIVTGVLAGIAGLVAFEAICEGAGCSGKLRDRYHE
jgi:hypothetical protein